MRYLKFSGWALALGVLKHPKCHFSTPKKKKNPSSGVFEQKFANFFSIATYFFYSFFLSPLRPLLSFSLKQRHCGSWRGIAISRWCWHCDVRLWAVGVVLTMCCMGSQDLTIWSQVVEVAVVVVGCGLWGVLVYFIILFNVLYATIEYGM